jgi:hypothetical protein
MIELKKKLKRLSTNQKFKELLIQYLTIKKIEFTNSENIIQKLLPENMRHVKNWIYALIDCAAFVLEIERIEKYTLLTLIEKIYMDYLSAQRSISALKSSINHRDIINLISEIKMLALKKDFSKLTHPSIYYYERLIEEFFKPNSKKNTICLI